MWMQICTGVQRARSLAPVTRMPPCLPTTLRERKREETARALARAAYGIVREQGVDAVTADAVAERAGVSRRTFFNYFPSVESVLTASVAELLTAVAARLESRPAGEDVVASVLAVVDDPVDLDLVERLGVLAEAGRSSAHAHTLMVGELHAWLDWFEGWLRRRLGESPSDLQVATLAATLMAAAEAAMRVWARGATAGSPAGPTFHEVLADALGYLRPALGALAAPR
jgi:AcrR family transcriptional regulator